MGRYSDYDPFAMIYDKYWGAESVTRFLPAVEELLFSRIPPRASILDLCCGTGQLAAVLSQKGFRVTGIDGSDAMLHYARSNAPEVEFRLEDARLFQLATRYHAVVSVYDSLNHVMSPGELAEVFQNVSACLLDEGIFLFDLNMEEGYVGRWRGGSLSIVEDRDVCIVRPSFDAEEKVGRADVTIFQEEGTTWRRSDFSLLQRCYSREEIQSALSEAGFEDIRIYEAQRDLGWERDPGRVFFLSRKAPGSRV